MGTKGGDGFARHRQPWTSDELQKLERLATKGMGLQAIAKATEARPVPFSERLSDLQGGQVPGRIPDVPPPPSSAVQREPTDAKAPPPPNDAAKSATASQATKPRGSLLNIVV